MSMLFEDRSRAESFGDVADSLGFLHRVRDGATLTVARTGETPRRDDRVADVDVRSGDRLTLVDSINALFSVTPDAIAATLVVSAPTGAVTEFPLRYGDNLLGRDVEVADIAEVSALGVAQLAWQQLSPELDWTADRARPRTFSPTLDPADRRRRRAVWAGEVVRARLAPAQRKNDR